MANKELTETQRLFLKILVDMNLEKGLIVGLMLMLKEEEQMDKMVAFIKKDIHATTSQLLQAALEINEEKDSLEEN